jgi:hypothetical protein
VPPAVVEALDDKPPPEVLGGVGFIGSNFWRRLPAPARQWVVHSDAAVFADAEGYFMRSSTACGILRDL